jgi:acetyl esterase/lipase
MRSPKSQVGCSARNLAQQVAHSRVDQLAQFLNDTFLKHFMLSWSHSSSDSSEWLGRWALVMVLFVFAALFGASNGYAAPDRWAPDGGHTQLLLWPGEPPDQRRTAGPETVRVVTESPVAGRPWIAVDRVSEPTLTLYEPRGLRSGAAVIVFPGGGYMDLAIDLEGSEVCEWLASIGVTGVLLKYRVPGVEGYPDGGYRKSGAFPRSALALEDAQRAIRLVRFHAAEWQLDPHKIGVLGFSAGGHLSAAVSTQFDRRVYSPVDEADGESCRPDFAALLYPGHLWNWNYQADPEFVLNPDVPVSHDTPPAFIVHAQDDPVDDVNHSLVYFAALKKAGVPAEVHLYAEGGHAFGLRATSLPITRWPRLYREWLRTLGVLKD